MYYSPRDRKIHLDGIDTNRDYFEINNITYEALPLDSGDESKGKGVNSSVFLARRSDTEETFAVKISTFWHSHIPAHLHPRAKRFDREIDALKRALASNKTEFVLQLIDDDFIQLGAHKHRCYISEAADYTLESYLQSHPDIIMQQRLLLCFDILKCVGALHNIGIYHRDIKPANIFWVNGTWKIADLGLVQFRDDDVDLDYLREKIGPLKWITPEALNKNMHITRSDNGFVDVSFCDKSDIYQLGKLFWYIVQGDIPNGCLNSSDLVVARGEIYSAFLRPMLRYKRADRPSFSGVERAMVPLQRRYLF